MSFFNEYFLKNGFKTLREYTNPVDLNRFNKLSWRTNEKDLGEIMEELDNMKHHSLITEKQIRNLRKADPIERKAGDIAEYTK
jgi:hypothetical protein